MSLLAASACNTHRVVAPSRTAASAFDIESIQEQSIDINDKKEGALSTLKLPHGSVAAAKKPGQRRKGESDQAASSPQ